MPLWVAVLLFQQLQPLDIPERNPHATPADIEQGRRLYMGRCAGCHGPTGEGGKGANLAVPELSRAATDRALFRVIRYGIPDTEMPGSLMDTHELWQTAAFVRTLGQVAGAAVTGNAAAGREVFRTAGCMGCHAINNDGGNIGPSLSGVGARRGTLHLRRKIEQPSVDVPEQYRVLQITTKSGKSFRGVRLNEDTFSIQFRDFSGNLQSLWKDDISQLTSERKSNMPAYASRLRPEQITDLVAYLSAQRSAQ